MPSGGKSQSIIRLRVLCGSGSLHVVSKGRRDRQHLPSLSTGKTPRSESTLVKDFVVLPPVSTAIPGLFLYLLNVFHHAKQRYQGLLLPVRPPRFVWPTLLLNVIYFSSFRILCPQHLSEQKEKKIVLF